jgi:hypothetical protein
MHPQHQILCIFRRLVSIPRLRFGRAGNALGTTEPTSQAGQWCSEARGRRRRFGTLGTCGDDLRR